MTSALRPINPAITVYNKTVNVALPPAKNKQGTDLGQAKDKNGVYFVRELMEQATKGGGFVQYVFPKPPSGQDVLKLGYAEMIPGTDMWIGTGIYIGNIDHFVAALNTEMNGQVRSSLIRMVLTSGAFSPLSSPSSCSLHTRYCSRHQPGGHQLQRYRPGRGRPYPTVAHHLQ